MSTRNGIASAGRRQKGTVAIIVGLSLAVLIGFVGLALDLGRLYVNKTELQSAADACALAAAAELVCVPGASACPVSYLQNAEAAGIYAAGRNSKDFQASGVSVAAADVRFNTAIGPNAEYKSRTSAGVDTNSKFAMCIARSNGIVPWFMGVLGIGASDVGATAVATLAPGQGFCPSVPIGLCNKGGVTTGDFGYGVGEWVASDFTSGNGGGKGKADEDDDSGNLTGAFKWVDFSANPGGNKEIRQVLAGSSSVCGLRKGVNIQQTGQQQGAKSAYNTRFGIYANGANAYTPQNAPPDRTGYAYPNKAPGSPMIGVGTSAYNDYLRRRDRYDAFKSSEYAGNVGGNPVSGGAEGPLGQSGSARRLVTIPVIDCSQHTTPILGMACVLLLNPMNKGAGTLYVEYRGAAGAAGSPCHTYGLPGGSAGDGPLVPTLVQ